MTQRKDFSKPSKIVRFIINFYLLIIASALIAVGLRLVNYVECSSPEVHEIEGPIFVNNIQIYTFYLIIHESQLPTQLVYDEDYTSAYLRTVLNPPTSTKWEIIIFRLWFETNGTIDLWFTGYDPQGNVIENITKIRGWGADIAQAGIYMFEIKKYYNTQDIPILLHVYTEKLVFEKKYFHYGIFGISVAMLCPTLFLTLRVLISSLVSKFKPHNI